MTETTDQPDNAAAEKSKSQLKREMLALQDLGKRLTQLNAAQLNQVPMTDTLKAAIVEYQRLRKGEALRRQLQYLGRIMRKLEHDEIAAISHAINYFDASETEHTQRFHQIEIWRDRLLSEKNALCEYMNEYPDTDIQHLRQLVRNAQKEQSQQKSLGNARKLFRYVREMIERKNSIDT